MNETSSSRSSESKSGTANDNNNGEGPWERVIMPGLLRRRFRDQFESQLASDLEPLVDIESPIRMTVVLNAFDAADRKIGLHWPIIAKKLWEYGFDPLITSYVETSENMLAAMQGIISTPTTIYPALNLTVNSDRSGTTCIWRPTYPLSVRHWDILQLFLLLGQTAFFKRLAPKETKEMVCNTTYPRDEFSEVLENLAGCKINFGVAYDDVYTFLPMDLLRVRTPFPNKSLNKLLYKELSKRTLLPGEDDVVINELRRSVMMQFPELMSMKAAAASIQQSSRTLQRILGRNGLSYTGIRNAQRKEFVLLSLTRADDLVGIHSRLGFPTRDALNRFCVKNFDQPLSRLVRSRK